MSEEVTVFKREGFKWLHTLKPGDTWAVHPAGGIIVANPEHPPLWCRVENDCLVQSYIGEPPCAS